MAVLRPRTRLVYFRLSEDEFNAFSKICEREGARSISDLARRAVLGMVEQSNKLSASKNDGVNELKPLLMELNSRLSILVQEHED